MRQKKNDVRPRQSQKMLGKPSCQATTNVLAKARLPHMMGRPDQRQRGALDSLDDNAFNESMRPIELAFERRPKLPVRLNINTESIAFKE